MDPKTAGLDAAALRAQLMAADPMQGAMALHAIELELGSARASASSRAFAREVENFTARGIPFYAPQDRHFRDWWRGRLHIGRSCGAAKRGAG